MLNPTRVYLYTSFNLAINSEPLGQAQRRLNAAQIANKTPDQFQIQINSELNKISHTYAFLVMGQNNLTLSTITGEGGGYG